MVRRFRCPYYLLLLTFFLLPRGEKCLATLDPGKPVSEYAIEIWGAERGLDVFAIHSIIQSRDGFLWLGTDEGLVRFDGTQFIRFDRSNTPGMASDNITSVVQDDSGSLWMGTRGGGMLRYRDGTFTRYSGDDGLPGDSVNCLYIDDEGTLWIGLDQGNVCTMRDGIFRTFPGFPAAAGMGIHTIVREGRNLYASSATMLLAQRDGVDTVLVKGNASFVLRSLRRDSSGKIWIGASSGVYVLEGSALRRFETIPSGTSVAVPAIFDDSDGNLWIGTEGDGLYRYSRGRSSRLSLPDGLSSDRILSFCEDTEGNLWIGTRGGGLMRLRDNSISITTKEDGLSDEFVTTVLEGADSTLWIGTRDGGVNEMRNGVVVRSYAAIDGMPGNFIRALEEDRQGNIWVGTGTSLACLKKGNPGGRRSVVRFGAADGLPDFSVRALKVDRNGVLWVGSYGGGVLRMENGVFRSVDPDRRILPSENIRAIVEEADGTLWIGSQGGLSRYSGGAWETFTADGGLAPNIVFTLHPGDDGTLWIGTYSRGLYRYRNGEFRSIRKKDGLFDDVVYTILDDGLGYFWMTSNKGIFRVRKRDLDDFADVKIDRVVSQSYGVSDGMRSAECNGATQPAGWKGIDQTLHFPTVKGLASLKPGAMRANDTPPLVRIDLALADNDTLDISAGAVLGSGVRRLEIRYVGINFFAPEKIRFRYILEGFDDQWIDADTRRRVYYTNIPPGDYIFRVKASNSEGIWNETGASLAVRLPPQLHETWWFRISGALVLAAGVVVFVRRREAAIKADERKKQDIRAQMLELESRALRARMNPHFIFNALNAVQESILDGKTEAACAYLSKFARLLRMILDHSGRSVVTLDQDLELLRLYVEIESLRFDREFNPVFDVAEGLLGGNYMIPPMLLQPFVENAIWHGLARKEGERRLLVSASQSGDTILLTVEDNGIGRSRSAELKRGMPDAHESKGVGLTQERIGALNAMRAAKAQLAIIDLTDDRGAAAGTRVELSLPIGG